MSDIVVGIDLGTATSELFIFRKGAAFPQGLKDRSSGSIIVPSVVAFPSINAKKPVVGEEALSYRGTELCFEEVKRQRGERDTQQQLVKIKRAGREFYPEEIESYILRHLIENASILLGTPIQKAVITVPAVFAEDQRQATKRAAKMANLEVEILVQEPIAAAIAYGIDQLKTDEQVLIFDFGGGTLDISIIELNNGVICATSAGGDPKLGGKDIDESFASYLLDRIKKQGLTVTPHGISLIKSAAEKYKKILSFEDEIKIDDLAGIVDQEGKIAYVDLVVSRLEFERCIKPILDKIKTLLDNTISEAKLNLAHLDKVLLVGGSTYIPSVKKLIEHTLNKKINTKPIDPDTSVGAGAAILHAIRNEWVHNLFTVGVSPFSLGVEICTQVNGMLIPHIYEEILPKNVNLPYRFEKEYSLIHPKQTEVEFVIYQDMNGQRQFTRDSKGNIPEGMFFTGITQKLVNIPPSSNDIPNRLNLIFEYEETGDINLSAHVIGTDSKLKNEFVKVDFSEQALKLKTEQLNQEWADHFINSDDDIDVIELTQQGDDYFQLNSESTETTKHEATVNEEAKPIHDVSLSPKVHNSSDTNQATQARLDDWEKTLKVIDILNHNEFIKNKNNIRKAFEAKEYLSSVDAKEIDEQIQCLLSSIREGNTRDIEEYSESLSDLLFDLGV